MADKDTKDTIEPARTAFYKGQEGSFAGHFGKVIDLDVETSQITVEMSDGRQVRVTVSPPPVLVTQKEAVKSVLPEATQKALDTAGYRTPGQIAAATDDELKAVPGIGDATLKQIRDAFASEGA